MSDHDVEALAKILPAPPPLAVPDVAMGEDQHGIEEVSATDINMEEEMKQKQQQEEDEEEAQGGRRGAQCAQQ